MTQALETKEAMSEAEVRDVLDSVSKDNFGDEICFYGMEYCNEQETKELTYFHREDYETGYTVD